MKRISKEAKIIADAHIEARRTGNFDNPTVNSKDELIVQLKAGKTFERLMEEVEFRFCSIGSQLVARHFACPSSNYKASIYKGFKTILP